MAIAPAATNQTNLQVLATANDIKGNVAHFIPDAVDGAGSKSEKAAIGLNTDFTHFIRMLTTQLKNQDPTDPLDANQFTQQIVAFTGVEQAVATNSNLEKLIELNRGVQFSHASGLIGKEVVYDASNSELKMGESITFGYSLEPESTQKINSTSIKVINSAGTIVRTLDGATVSGIHSIYWDGLDYNKKKCPNDNYRIVVNSVDSDGMPIKVGSSVVSGMVKEAEITKGAVLLNINGKKIPISQVRSIKSQEDEEKSKQDETIEKAAKEAARKTEQKAGNNQEQQSKQQETAGS